MYRPDSLDRQLISQLQKDGRTPYVELAHAAGVSEATVRRRVERLIGEGVLQVVAYVEPCRVGLGFEAMLYLQADLDKLTQIGQQLAALPEVREVIYTSGAYDLVLKVVLPSSEDLLPFLTQQVATIPGIKMTQTAYVLQTEKRVHEWQLVDLPDVPEGEPARPLILLVDDDADFVAAACMVLEAEGYRVISAGNGREALSCLRGERPAVVLLDVMMETPLAGLEVARAIRGQRRLQGLPLLAISAIRSSEWASKLPEEADLPFDDFVDKPIEPRLLVDKVRRFTG